MICQLKTSLDKSQGTKELGRVKIYAEKVTVVAKLSKHAHKQRQEVKSVVQKNKEADILRGENSHACTDKTFTRKK